MTKLRRTGRQRMTEARISEIIPGLIRMLHLSRLSAIDYPLRFNIIMVIRHASISQSVPVSAKGSILPWVMSFLFFIFRREYPSDALQKKSDFPLKSFLFLPSWPDMSAWHIHCSNVLRLSHRGFEIRKVKERRFIQSLVALFQNQVFQSMIRD